MPATIIETNNTPFAKKDIDPVTLDIIENALRNARVEMDAQGKNDRGSVREFYRRLFAPV